MTSPVSDPVFTTATDALKAARDEHADELAAHVPPKYTKQSKLRHWWESKKGEWRMKLREWLGIQELAMQSSSDGYSIVQLEHDLKTLAETVKVLRQDFDAATQANVDIFRNYDHRITQTEHNVETLRAQFHASSREHGRMLSAFRSVPMNGVAWRKFCENERIANERKLRDQKKVAGAIAPTEGVTRPADQVSMPEVPDLPVVTVPPNAEIHPHAEPIEVPHSD